MGLMFRHCWVLFIAATCLNALALRLRSRQYIAADPSLAPGYSKLVWYIVVFGNIPWLIQGLGAVVGHVPPAEFLRPQHGNPFVIASLGSIIILWAMVVWWVLVRGGDEVLARHPGLFSLNFGSRSAVRLFFYIVLAAGIGGLVMILFQTDGGQLTPARGPSS